MDQPAPRKPLLRPASFATALLPPAVAVGLYMLGTVLGWWPSMPGLRLWLLPWALAGIALALWGRRAATTLLLTGTLGTGLLVLAIGVNFKAVRVEGNSMLPGLQPGDVLLVDMTSTEPMPGGVYVLDVEGEEHNPLIKRLVAMPGEQVEISYGRVMAEGREVYPRDGTPSNSWNENRPAGGRGAKLGEGEYFFIGDNPPDSRDSRQFGPVKGEAIEGRVVWSLRGSLGFGPAVFASGG